MGLWASTGRGAGYPASQTVYTASIVCPRNGSQKLLLISRRFAEISLSVSDWLDSYAPCVWTFSYASDHAILRIAENINPIVLLFEIQNVWVIKNSLISNSKRTENG